MVTKSAAAVFCIALLVLAAGCGGGDGEAADNRLKGPDLEAGVVGTVRFEKRTIDSLGRLSAKDEVVLRPARYVRVEVVDADGGFISRTVTDGQGDFGIGGSFPEGFRVLVFPESPADNDPSVPVRVLDLDGHRYAARSSPQPAIADGERQVVDVTAAVDTPLRVAGAFNIVNTIQEGALFWTGATGRSPESVEVRWESGGFRQPPTSFFDPFANRITLVGGVEGLEDSSDTDEFDDTVIGHEYLHFLQVNYLHSSSPGGPHGGEELVPNLAFEEGLADWFGVFLTGEPRYQDTWGSRDGSAFCGFCDNLESSVIRLVDGIGSEQSVYEILWDLTDGLSGQVPDRDGDRIGIPAGEILRALGETRPDRDYLYIGTLLDVLVSRGTLRRSDARSVLSFPSDHDITFPVEQRSAPPTGKDIFPIPIAPGETLAGAVDAVSAANTRRGFDSIRYYKLSLPRGGRVSITLRIAGSGRAPEDLDLRLLHIDNRIIRASEGTGPEERITVDLPSGVFIIQVLGFFLDRGNVVPSRGSYTLEVN